MITWQQVVDCGLQLPGSELSTSYGRPALKVRNKMYACVGKEDDHFVLMVVMEEAAALMENDPRTFFKTPHYERSNAVLVRYRSADKDLVEVLLRRCWSRRASKSQRLLAED